MIRFAICDDDQTMTGYLDNSIMALSSLYDQEFEVSVFFSGESFCEYLNNSGELFDIVLMDIEMRGITGVEAGQKLRENVVNDRTMLIFVSSHKSYFQEIIDLNVFCFIPKPIHHDEFNLKLGKAVKRIIRQQQLLWPIDFVIRKNQQETHVPINAIMYLISDIRQIHLHATSGVHTYYGKLNDEEIRLSAYTFVRIHRSYLINFAHAASITAKFVTMEDGRQFPISDQYREEFKTAYVRYRGSGS